jgi:hypothetical protein
MNPCRILGALYGIKQNEGLGKFKQVWVKYLAHLLTCLFKTEGAVHSCGEVKTLLGL